ncbi:5'-AMP-activated protein kinase subunit gamma [Acrasis kona]|uniref:5'-AMP-activated protein kinase subunit gamma n=1 Tax=Acrasis kona TaxID=1008807 RepID=A0AAW2ZM56_9EUKA
MSVRDIAVNKKREIVSISQESSVKEALQLLSKNNILSAPVYDGEKCVGLVDVLDLTTFVTNVYFTSNKESQFKNYLVQFSFELEKVSSVMNFSQRNPYVPVSLDTPLNDVLSKFAGGVHRVPVLEGEKVTFLLTQTALLAELEASSAFQSIKDKTISELKVGVQGSLQSVSDSSITIDAFKLISDSGVSAVAVKSATGKVVGALSASDLQGFIGEELFHLGSNVVDFLTFARKKKNDDRDNMVHIKAQDTLGTAVTRILSTRVHRLFIVDEKLEVVGLLTLTDVFKIINDQ